MGNTSRLKTPLSAGVAQAIQEIAESCNCDAEVVRCWLRPLLTGLTLDDLAFMAAVNTPFQGKVTITLDGSGHLEHFGTTVNSCRALALMGWSHCVPRDARAKAREFELIGNHAQLR